VINKLVSGVKRVGSIKKPGTFERTKVVSGVVGKGGGVFSPSGELLSKPSASTLKELEAKALMEEGREQEQQQQQVQAQQQQSQVAQAVKQQSLRDKQRQFLDSRRVTQPTNPLKVQLQKRIEKEKPKTREFLFGESGEKYVAFKPSLATGVTVSFSEKDVGRFTARDVKTALETGKVDRFIQKYEPTPTAIPKLTFESPSKTSPATLSFIKTASTKPIRTGEASLFSKTVAYNLPTKPGEIAIIAGTTAAFPYLPGIVQVGIGGTIAVVELPKAFDPTRPPEERISSGIIGGTAAFGTATSLYPYAKGGLARFSKTYRPTETSVVAETFVRRGNNIFLESRAGRTTLKANTIPFVSPMKPLRTPGTFISFEKLPGGVTAVRDIVGVGNVAIIKPGKGSSIRIEGVADSSPLQQGAFGFPSGVRAPGKTQFLGGPQTVVSSQANLPLKTGKNLLITEEIFFTPQEPILKVGQARLSRLGLQEFFKFQKNIEYGVGLPGQPKIVIERGATVTTTGLKNTFKLGPSTELEVTKAGAGFPNIILKDVQRPAITTIKGQRVDIYTVTSREVPGTTSLTNILPTIETPSSSLGGARVSSELVFSTSATASKGFSFPTRTSTTTSIPSTSAASVISVGPYIPKSSPIVPTKRTSSTRISTPTISLTPPITTITPPISPPSSPPIRTTYPTTTPPRSPTRTPPYYPRSSTPKLPKLPKFKPYKQTKSRGRFTVLGRRFGKFSVVGVGRTREQAFSLGKKFATGTLGRSFTVRGSRRLKLPGFRTKKESIGTVFIQKTGKGFKSTLGSIGEKQEIQLFRQAKTKKKKKGGKKK